MAPKFFTGLPLDGPDPECVRGNAEPALALTGTSGRPHPDKDHSRSGTPRRTVTLGMPAARGTTTTPDRACDTSPRAGLR